MTHKIKFEILLLVSLFICSALFAKDYTNINAGWKFAKSNPANAQQSTFDDSAWENTDLPHTWNALDGQDGGNNYFRGIGWYRKQFIVPASENEKIVYLKIGAANTSATVFVNGNLMGNAHRWLFCFYVRYK
jgi:beta-galactosidase